MNVGFEQPWFLLLWIVCLLIVIVPIIVGGINAIISGYFREKEKHSIRIAKAIATALSDTLEKLPGVNKKSE